MRVGDVSQYGGIRTGNTRWQEEQIMVVALEKGKWDQI